MEIQKAERLSKLPPYLYVAIRQKVREAQARGVDVISLGVGDPDLPTPRHVVEALAKAAADPANHQYPTGEQKGMPAFRRAVAAWYARRFGVTVDPETEVLALIGSKEGNHHLALALLDPADVAIVPDPGYPAYIASPLFAGIDQVKEKTDSGQWSAVQYAAIAALEGPQDVIAHDLEIYKRRRDLAVATWRSLGLDLEPPQGTFYVWAPIPEGTKSMDFVSRLLDLTGVMVTPGIVYGSRGEGFVRMSLSVPDDRLNEAMARIAKVRDQLATTAVGSR